MAWLIWSGAGVATLGLLGILWVAWGVMRARKSGLDDAGLQAHLQKALPQNLAAFFVAIIGLMMVIVGVILG